MKMRGALVGLLLVFVLLAPVAVRATTYNVTVTLATAGGSVLWTMTKTVETPDSTLTVNIPQKLYDLIVGYFGTDSFTTPFSVAVAHQMLVVSVMSEPSGLTVKFAPVPAGEVVVDGRVDIMDAATLALSYSRGPGDARYNGMADFNVDGRVDILDAAALAANYGMSY